MPPPPCVCPFDLFPCSLLRRLLAEGTAAACCSAAEALTQIATTSDVRCRLIVRAGALPHLKPMLQPGSSSVSLLWACRLLKALAQVWGVTAGSKRHESVPLSGFFLDFGCRLIDRVCLPVQSQLLVAAVKPTPLPVAVCCRPLAAGCARALLLLRHTGA